MNTSEIIVKHADDLMRQKSYNSFSFRAISALIGIKTSSIHYHFPGKSNLGIAVIEKHTRQFREMIESVAAYPAETKLEAFFNVYAVADEENKVCLVGALASDYNTIEPALQLKLRAFATMVLEWVTAILEEGKKEGIFFYTVPAHIKALLIVANMLAAVQLLRLTDEFDFKTIKEAVMSELKNKI